MSAQAHQSDPRILGRRTLEKDHRYLAGLLQPGLSVLDVGCGTGAITAGIAKAIGPRGSAVGLDRDAGLLELARKEHVTGSNLQFELGDAMHLSYRGQFDIVTAARTLQWISEPVLALSNMRMAAKTNGSLVILDYDHAHNEWEPDAPEEFRRFYSAFLAWRDSNRWNNEIATRLPELLQGAGVNAIESYVQDEVAERGEPDFRERSTIWLEVIENVGEQIAQGGFCTKPGLQMAHEAYRAWIQTDLIRQRLAMRTVVGRVLNC